VTGTRPFRTQPCPFLSYSGCTACKAMATSSMEIWVNPSSTHTNTNIERESISDASTRLTLSKATTPFLCRTQGARRGQQQLRHQRRLGLTRAPHTQTEIDREGASVTRTRPFLTQSCPFLSYSGRTAWKAMATASMVICVDPSSTHTNREREREREREHL